LGQDAFYSGTVAAAREGALRGIPAIASSAQLKANFDKVAELTSNLARGLFELTRGSLGAGARPGPSVVRNTALLNLNVPRDWTGEVRRTKLGARIYEEVIDFRTDPRGREYLWLGGPGVRHERDPGSDTDAHDDGAASITPLVLDLASADPAGIADKVILAAGGTGRRA
jgi:5'-nucleotidase